MRTTPHFFTALPADLLKHMFSWLNLHGPKVQLIDGDPTDEEKATVTAVALDDQGQPDLSQPDLSTYHLIKDVGDTGESVYKIGFCQRAADDDANDSLTPTYEVKTLDQKSPLLRYVTEDFQHPDYAQLFDDKGHSQDRLLLKHMTLEIKAAGGLTCHPLRNRTHLAAVNQNANARMKGIYTIQDQTPLFEYTIKQALLDDLLHHVAYGEQEAARAILELHPSLLLSNFTAGVTDCSPERTFHKTTAFQLAVWNGDWRMWEMMLDVIKQPEKLSEQQRADYRADLLAQFQVVEEEGLEYTLDNLLNKGLRILDAQALQVSPDESRRLDADIIDRNAYHLIIRKADDGKVMSCVLGYRDPTTGEYMQHRLPPEDPLLKIADELRQSLQDAHDGHGARHSHFVTRAHRDLTLVKTVLDALHVPTQLTQKSSKQDFDPLEKALENRLRNFAEWSTAHRVEDWHVTISALLRPFSAHVWRLWMSKELPWANDARLSKYVQSDVRRLDPNYFGESISPVSRCLGDKFIALGPRTDWPRHLSWMQPSHIVGAELKSQAGMTVLAFLLKSILESRASKTQQLERHLKGQPDTQPCCLM